MIVGKAKLIMKSNLPAFTKENEEMTKKLEILRLEFVDLFTQHKDMLENESVILSALYLERLGYLQLELLEKSTETARQKMKMKLIQAAINRDETPNLQAIELELNKRLQGYYAQIQAQSAALDEARSVLSHLMTEEETAKLKEIFRLLCKRLHPDLNPNQSEEQKDLFVKVKAAYELKRLEELQYILLYLDDSNIEKLIFIHSNEKLERIRQLENNITVLNEKIVQLEKSFPFNIKAFLFDEAKIQEKQTEIKTQISHFEAEIAKYVNIINIMTDE
ncbi:MAG TPA: hypothetical protein DCG69_06515 [Bacteroidales bacterium]|nr:hypothetical protein [Bacteroidales bacterium]